MTSPPWRGRYVETPKGWGVCCKDGEELEVLLDVDPSTSEPSFRIFLRPEEVERSSWCAVGTCVLSSFGPGVVLCYRREDDMHEVQLWGPLSKGQNRAFLRRDALKEVLPALPGLAVETPQGPGVCQTVDPEQISVTLTEGGEVAWMSAKDVKCPVAKTLPLVNRFLDVAANMVKFHSGTLQRLADAFQGLGLGQLQDQLLSRASEAAGSALQLWDEWEAKDAKEVAETLKSQADAAMPKLQGLVSGLFSGLNQLISRALFDGQWIGKEDQEARCSIKDAVIYWHWGQDSDFSVQSMWSETAISTLLEGEIFKGTLRLDGCLQWSDGDVWYRRDGEEEAEEIAMDLRQLHKRVSSLREMMATGDWRGLEVEGLDEAVSCLSKIAQTASADEDVKVLASNLQEQMELCQQQLQWIQELGESKAGSVLLQGHQRLAEQLRQLQETAITPQLDAVQIRSQRFLTNLATDDKVKSKASQLFSAVEQRFADQLPQLEEWVQSIRSQVKDQLGLDRALLVDGLKALPVNQEALREILLASWDHTAKLEAQLESCILDALNASGVDCTGTELLNCFESSTAFSNIPALRESSGSLLSLLKDLQIEVPSAVQNLLEAHAAGRTPDATTWKEALKSSFDDDVMVKGATGIVEHSERVVAKLQELKENQAVVRVVEQLEKNEDMDIERELMSRIHDFNPEQVLSTAEEAWTNIEAREELVNHLKDTCLDLILKILPAIQIEKVNGKDDDCDWEISNINFSDFSFRKEDVRVTLNDLNAADEVLRISAWDISAHFYGLKVSVCPQSRLMSAECTGDAKAERMSLDLAFRWERPPADSPDGSLPQLVMCSRSIHMESLDLWVHETDWSVSTIVNALSYLFADVLKRYACEKICSKLDEHMAVLVEGLNSSLVSCAPLLKRLGFEDMLKDLGQESCPEKIVPKLPAEKLRQSWFDLGPVPNEGYCNPLASLG